MPIRPATVEDVAAIRPLMAVFNDHEEIVWRSDLMIAALTRLMREPALGTVLVACNAAGAVVGYGIATIGYDIEFSGFDAFITELFVAPEQRGRGTGRQLMDALIVALKARDVRAVHLVVRHENTRARTLYEKRGFVAVPRLLMTKVLEPVAQPRRQPAASARETV